MMPSTPSAIFAASDNVALGILRAVHEAGLRIPQDIAVAGFDDIESAVDVWPPLTTVRTHPHEMGRIAVRELLRQIADPLLESRICWVGAELIVREST